MKKKFYILTLLISCFTPYNFFFLNIRANENNVNKLITNIDNGNINQRDLMMSLKKTDSDINKDVYILGPGDVIAINFLNLFFENKLNNELFNQTSILNDGTVSIPYAGSVRIDGLTILQAKDKITKSLKSQIADPQVSIQLIKARPVRVSLIGEVNKPGLYNLTNSSQDTNKIESGKIKSTNIPKTLVDAIKLAGGITDNANLKKIILKRRIPSDEFSYKKAELDLYDLIVFGNQLNNPFLFDGDIIEVTKSKSRGTQNFEVLQTTISPEKISVNVIGEVNSPGKIEVMSNTPLMQAIHSAGGLINYRVNKSNVQLIRVNRDGTTSLKRFRINLNEDVSVKNNPTLKNGDTLIVRSNLFSKTGDSIKVISEPAGNMVNVITLIKLLNGSI